MRSILISQLWLSEYVGISPRQFALEEGVARFGRFPLSANSSPTPARRASVTGGNARYSSSVFGVRYAGNSSYFSAGIVGERATAPARVHGRFIRQQFGAVAHVAGEFRLASEHIGRGGNRVALQRVAPRPVSVGGPRLGIQSFYAPAGGTCAPRKRSSTATIRGALEIESRSYQTNDGNKTAVSCHRLVRQAHTDVGLPTPAGSHELVGVPSGTQGLNRYWGRERKTDGTGGPTTIATRTPSTRST